MTQSEDSTIFLLKAVRIRGQVFLVSKSGELRECSFDLNEHPSQIEIQSIVSEYEFSKTLKSEATRCNRKFSERLVTCPWMRSCMSMATSIRYRRKAVSKRTSVSQKFPPSKYLIQNDFEIALFKAITNLNNRSRWRTLGKWKRWSVNTASNIRKRMDRKLQITH